MENLEYIKKCIANKRIPDENKISLKMYCDFFENVIEKNIIEVELSNNSIFLIKNRACHVAHIMELHEFYDKNLKHKILKFKGSFSTIQGFLNMKKRIITLDTLKKANNGKNWHKATTRYRVLCFPFLNEALLYGTWYNFDIDKYIGKTKLIPKFIVNYRIQDIQLNFCIDKDRNDKEYFCISNVIAFKSNPRIINQSYLDIERIIEYLQDFSINRCICHNQLYGQQLKNENNCYEAIVSSSVHENLLNKKCYINSKKYSDNYKIKYLRLDTKTKKIINSK